MQLMPVISFFIFLLLLFYQVFIAIFWCSKEEEVFLNYIIHEFVNIILILFMFILILILSMIVIFLYLITFLLFYHFVSYFNTLPITFLRSLNVSRVFLLLISFLLHFTICSLIV